MKTILVDDELWSMLQFRIMCEDRPEIELVGEFESSEEALRYAGEHPVDFALLDIEMPGMNGLELARRLRELHPGVIIVFLTGHKRYLEDFIGMKADYYVLKPYTVEDVRDLLDRVKLLSGRLQKRVRFQTFGPFIMYVDGVPYPFQREKTMGRLREELKKAGVADIVKSSAGGKYLDTSLVECDLYRLLRDRNWKEYSGEYMSSYSWGENTLADLELLYQERSGMR